MTTTPPDAPTTTEPVMTAETKPQQQQEKRRTKVNHWYWVRQARLAEAVGLPTPYLCGRRAQSPTGTEGELLIELVGGLMAITRPRDCQQCIRVYERTLRQRQDGR